MTTNATLLDAAHRAYLLGQLEWSDVQAIQRQGIGVCAAHGNYAPMKWNGNLICVQCLDEGLHEELGPLL